MDPNHRRMTDSVLNLTLEIMYLLTGEDYTVVKKTTSKPMVAINQSQESDGGSRSQSPITAQSSFSSSRGENNNTKVLELANRIIHFLSGEVWQYLMEHKDMVKGVVVENHSSDTSDEINNVTTWEELGPSSTAEFTPSDCTDNSSVQVKNEPGSPDEDRLTNSDASGLPPERVQYSSAHIKLETVSCAEGQPACAEMFSPESDAGKASTFVKEEYATSEEGGEAYEPPYTDPAAFPDNFTETPNTPPIDHNLQCPMFENSSTLVETCTPSTAGKNPDSDSGTCFSEAPYVTSPQEGHPRSKPLACSKCSKCFSTRLSLFRHERLHVAPGKKGSCRAEGGPEFASNDPSDKSPAWTGGGRELGTSTKNGSSQRSHHPSSWELERKSPVQDRGGKKSRTNLKNATSESRAHQTGSFYTSEPVDPWTFKKASCVECGEVFPFKSQLVLHQRNHPSKSQFSCSECGKFFTSNSHLVVHQRVHTGEKPFGCSACPKRFATKSTLVIHQRVHTREKPYSCTECRKCFPCNSQLVIHQRTHTGEKPYSCLECGKGFISNSDLLRHRRVHTGERPFKCTECAKCFSQKSHLREHQKTHRR